MTQRIYTKTGDTGETGLFGGLRVSKADARVAAYGDVDELNAVIGWAVTQLTNGEMIARLQVIQADLFTMGAHLATVVKEGRKSPALPALPTQRIPELESWIDATEDQLPELRSFILPGGSPGGAALHVARTVCRRAERAVVALAAAQHVDPIILVYLNRLSDLLFDFARLANRDAGSADTVWRP